MDTQRMQTERERIRSAFPPNMDVEQLVDDPKVKLPSPVMQQMLETYRLMRELETKHHHPELVTQWRDFAPFFQKNVRMEILDYVERPCQRVRFKGMWLPALSACAKVSISGDSPKASRTLRGKLEASSRMKQTVRKSRKALFSSEPRLPARLPAGATRRRGR